MRLLAVRDPGHDTREINDIARTSWKVRRPSEAQPH